MNDLETRKHGASRSTERQTSGYSAAALTPAVDVVEDGSAITLCADLPGVSKDKLQIQTESNTLTIEAEIDVPMPDGLQSTHTEVAVGRFRRTFRAE